MVTLFDLEPVTYFLRAGPGKFEGRCPLMVLKTLGADSRTTHASSGKHLHLSISLPPLSLRPLLQIGTRIRRVLLAQDCVLCQAACGDGLLCAACERDLPAAASSCPRCALSASNNAECGACLAHPPHYDASIAAYVYTYPLDRLVHALKYSGQLALAALFARALHRRIGDAAGVDLIAPLPLHPERLAQRGFNQAAEIAKILSRLTGIAAELELGRRVRNTAAQTDLPLRERAANVRGAFACPRKLSGLRIAVVDDVMTTGATLDEFARALKQSGAARVENWIVARTPRSV